MKKPGCLLEVLLRMWRLYVKPFGDNKYQGIRSMYQERVLLLILLRMAGTRRKVGGGHDGRGG